MFDRNVVNDIDGLQIIILYISSLHFLFGYPSHGKIFLNKLQILLDKVNTIWI